MLLIFGNFTNGGNTFIAVYCLDPIKINTIGQDIPIFVPSIPVDEIYPALQIVDGSGDLPATKGVNVD
ncbi:MAG: hypothetical protein CM1200mP10_19100 [Candidatus Neomarinimicrobiota bacterium]|nr:MAG: hypothetical protein CM1200mP10_19100 [Candidatus Neomarinimicrobiota bacterium]